ncbi:SGNH/GDSL hydrolase family protein [Pedobacter nutrimenti]|uniref:SGNH/GDSL hydrolase family protein n=1 Tax=Pedobacter nutrimenti TaxID=1241337 RepID=UPI00292E89FC|nr:SGNH/GDSL hydrolase family protein [Pedobacter nutrimenti]
MKLKFCTLFISTVLLHLSGYSQSFQWNNPVNAKYPVIDGRLWQTGLKNTYDRLPPNAEENVRKELWDLSQNSAGEYITFITDSREIKVQFQVNGKYIHPNNTAINMSGVDLYAKDIKNNWHWISCKSNFSDTISFQFNNISAPLPIKEYRLYLPLYKTLSWLKIGVPMTASFQFQKVNDQEKPLVIYGTSILQGASASRPGLAWSNILGRKLNTKIINLGFSGNGQLEPALIDLIGQFEASLYVLDCLPNLYDRNKFSNEEVEKRIINSIKNLQQKHPLTPILLTEHASSLPDITLDSSISNNYRNISQLLSNTFHKLQKEGVKNIYLLKAKEIGFTYESTIDGTHPNDIGMMQYANAYEKIIKEILKKK